MADACGHNFCQNCLLTIINEENEWLCPICRSEQSKRPDELMRNRLVERAVESFNASLSQNEATSLCSDHNLAFSLCKFEISNQTPSKIKLYLRLRYTSKETMLPVQLRKNLRWGKFSATTRHKL